MLVALLLASVRFQRDAGTAMKCAVGGASVGVAYLTPNIAASAVTALRFRDGSGVTSADVVSVVSLVGVLLVVCFCDASLFSKVSPPPTTTSGAAASTTPGWMKVVVVSQHAITGSPREPDRIASLAFAVEDITVAVGISVVSSLFPTTLPGCRGIAAVTLMTAALHITYIVYVRPFPEKMDQALAVVNALILLLLSATGFVVAATMSIRENSSGFLKVVFGVLQLCCDGAFIAQSVFLAVHESLAMRSAEGGCCASQSWADHPSHRHRHSTDGDDTAVSTALLQLPQQVAIPPDGGVEASAPSHRVTVNPLLPQNKP